MKDGEEIIRHSNEIYDRARAEGQTPHDRVLYANPARQYYRFAEILRLAGDITASGLTILDIGCGNGEMLKFLNFNGFRGHYRGVDIHAGHIEEARQRFPEAEFSTLDPLSAESQPASLVIMSGVVNLDVGQDANYAENLVRRCATLARDRLIFNSISTYVNHRDPRFIYLAPEDAVGIAARISRRFELRHGFLPFNYTMCIHLDDSAWRSLPW